MTNDDLRARLLHAFRGWHSPIEAFISATDAIMRTAIYDVPALRLAPTYFLLPTSYFILLTCESPAP